MSRKWTFLKRPLFQKTPFSEPEHRDKIAPKGQMVSFSRGHVYAREGSLRGYEGSFAHLSPRKQRQWGMCGQSRPTFWTGQRVNFSPQVPSSFCKLCRFSPDFAGCSFFAYSWKLPAHSGAFLLTVDSFSFSTYNWSFFAYNLSFFTYNCSFFAYSGKVRLISALKDCKQRSLTASKKAPTVSKSFSRFCQFESALRKLAKLRQF